MGASGSQGRLSQCLCLYLAICLASCGGCAPQSPPDKGKTAARRTAEQPAVRKSGTGTSKSARRPTKRPIRSRSARQPDIHSKDPGFSQSAAVQRTLDIIHDSARHSPTLVVWFMDVSPSAMQWGSVIHSDVRKFYDEVVPSMSSDQAGRLQSAVVTFGKDVVFALEPTDDAQRVCDALDALQMDDSGREATFKALGQALDKYLPVRIKQHHEVLFVVVTDESGDDWQQVDKLIDQPRKYALPVYAIGVPAPFGRLAALDAGVEPQRGGAEPGADSENSWRPILQGPESRYQERMHLQLNGSAEDLELMNSGFGPFALEWLCRVSGGAFLAVSQPDSGSRLDGIRGRNWPSFGVLQFDPAVMRSYVPDQLDEAAYRALLETNQARMAVHQAAKMPTVEVLHDAQRSFIKRTEADLKNRLDKAQQAAARVSPAVDELYNILKKGAGDREKLMRPRWQAAYDLSYGRVCAAKARIDGYNAMLAALKRGRAFEKADSQRWVLERATTTKASSAIQNLIKRADTLLQRVVDEHSGTPWARIAEHELETPMGWQWTEQP